MILQPTTVELTKIHYYDSKNVIPTISREVFDNHVNSNVKKQLFGNKWVLKINEIGPSREKFQWRLVGVLILSCVIVAVVFGLYFTLSRRWLLPSKPARQTVPPTTHQNITKKFCQNCAQICMKFSEIDTPQCVQALDRKDPTGCGGFCAVNTQFCQLLDKRYQVYQCSNLRNILKCPGNTFNCGNMCINANKRCDGIIHCSNKSDELKCDCNLDTHFRCGNMTSCISKEKKCDQIVDCWDKSDEVDCKKGCKNGRVPCLNGDCVLAENVCDGKYHCSDHSDEPPGCQL